MFTIRLVEILMPTRRNGNGRKGGNGERSDVPRWVRVLFDQHEVRMAALERAHEEHVENMKRGKAEHEALMAEMRAETREMKRDVQESRRQTREVIKELSRIDAERSAETAARQAGEDRNLAEHKAIMAALDAIRRGVPPPAAP